MSIRCSTRRSLFLRWTLFNHYLVCTHCTVFQFFTMCWVILDRIMSETSWHINTELYAGFFLVFTVAHLFYLLWPALKYSVAYFFTLILCVYCFVPFSYSLYISHFLCLSPSFHSNYISLSLNLSLSLSFSIIRMLYLISIVSLYLCGCFNDSSFMFLFYLNIICTYSLNMSNILCSLTLYHQSSCLSLPL